MTRKINFLLVLILLSCAIHAQQITQQFTFSQNDLQITQSGDYDVISLTDESFLQGEENAGKPQMPVKQFKLLLPQGASATNVSLTINTEQQLTGSYYLYPVQLPLYPNFEDPPPFVEPDPAIYNSDNPFPENYIFEYATSGFRDYNYVTVNFTPFRYIPLSRQLHLLTSITITIDYTIHTLIESHKLRPYGSVDETAYEFIKRTVVNPAQTDIFYADVANKINQYKATRESGSGNRGFEPTELPALEGSPVDYVIITNNTDVYGNTVGDFTNKFQEFADWKIQSGSPAKVITVDAIRNAYPGVDIAEQIREFIKDAHKLWGTEFVLLGGNASIVPVRWIKGNYMPTDLYYSAIWSSISGYDDNWNFDGDVKFGENYNSNTSPDKADYTPEIAVGRAPVDTDAEVDLFLKKNFTYYRCSFAPSIPDGNWLNKHLNLQGITFERSWNSSVNGLRHSFNIIQNHHNNSDIYGMFEYFENWEVDTIHPDWCPAYYPTDTNGCTTNGVPINDEYLEHDAVVNQINQRYGIINHFEHSGPLGLGLCFVTNSTTGLRASDFQNLNATNKYSVFVSGGCETMPIASSYYISEQWITAPNGGVAFIGATVDFGASASFNYNYGFFNTLYNSNIHNIGLINSFTAENCGYSNINYLYKIVNLLGDPELSIYTDTLVNMNVTYNSTITTGNSDFSINVTGFPSGKVVKLCLYKENDVHVDTESSTGVVTFNITPDTPGEMKLTVTCHNAEPYETTINVTQNPGVHLYKSNLTIIDENGNGFVEPGETIDLNIELSNSGETNASGITGVLTTSDTNTVITQNTSAYPNIPSVQTGTSLVNYTFVASTDSIYNGKVIPFELNITSAQGSFTEPFFLNLKSTQLEPGNRTVLVSGIETNTFNPGDAAELFVDIHNYGTVTASNLTAVLSTGLPSNIVTISTGTQNYGDIESFEKATNVNPFTFNVGMDYNGEELIFELTLTDNFGKTDVFELNLTEDLPALITGFDFSSGKNDITIIWSKVDDIKGYNIYRSDAETGTYEKMNNFIVSGTSMYYDPEVDELSEYFYKVSVISITGNERNFDELVAYKAWTSLDVHAIYPIAPAGSVANSSQAFVAVADIDGNATNELFPAFCKLRDGMLMGFYETGQELYNIDGNETSVSGFAKIILPENINGSTDGGELRTGAAIGDIDNDGNSEVFVTTYGSYYEQKRGYLFGFKTIDEENPINQPDPLWDGVPVNLGHRSYSSPVLADLDGDGYMEIITNQEKQGIKIFNSSGILLHERQIGNKWYSFGYLAVADLNSDGTKEIVIGTLDPSELYILNADLTDFNGINPIYSSSTHRLDANPVIADIDNDDEYEILITGRNGSTGNLYAFNIDGSFASGKWDGQISINFVTGQYTEALTPQPAVGDLNNDGLLEVVIADKNKVYVFDNFGNSIDRFPVDIDDLNFGRCSPILADIDSDDEIEIIIAASNDRIYAFNPDGTECVGWRLSSKCTDGFAGTPTISDLDNDGYNEMIISDASAKTHVWKTTGDADKIEWGSYRANAQNTGTYRIECKFSDIYTIEITGANTVWDYDKHIQGHLIVKANSDLTIHSKVTFVEESKIIVEPGAKLTIDGGTLTNKCGNMWQGIEVWGDKNSHQFEIDGICAQGKLVLKDALIENAYEAIKVWEPGNFNSTGGIIFAKNTTFRNCRRAAEFISYRNYHPYIPQTEMNNLSYFKNCTFEIDENYDQPSAFYAFISQWKVKGVDFYGCRFHNLDNTSNPYGIGIISIDAGYSVTSYCDDIIYPCPPENTVYSEFSGFQKGIECSNEETSYYVTVKYSNFSDNIYGIYNNGSNNQVVVFNDFETTKSTGLYSINILLNGCTGFTVEENNFTSTVGPPYNDFYPYGIWVNNSGEDENLIYKNNFSNMYIANYASGINLNERNEAIGLKYECNTNLNNVYDFFVDNRSGISTIQGSIERAAGNTFTHNITPDGSDFANNGNWIIQYYYDEFETYEIPENYYGLETDRGGDHPCISNFGFETPKLTTVEKSQLEQSYSTNTTGFNDALTVYNSFNDEGNTSNLVSDINNYQPGQTNELRGRLLNDSPHLSEEALKKAADKWVVLPHNILFEILSANPDEMGDEEFLDYLANKPDPLPEYMIDLLRDTLGIVTYKTILKNDMSYYSSGRHYAATKLLINELADTSYSSLDSLRYWLNEKNNLGSEFSEVDSYLHDEDTTEAVNILASISNTIELNEWAQSEVDYFTILKNLLITLKSNDQTIFDIDSIQKLTLNTIADSSSYIAGAQARGILHFVFHEDSLLIPSIPDTTLLKNSPVNFTNPFEKEVEKIFKVIPNPAKDWLSFEYIMPDNTTKANIVLIDNFGTFFLNFDVYQQRGVKNISLIDIPSGTYICLFRANGVIHEMQKIIIIK